MTSPGEYYESKRREAARSVAQKLANERGEPVYPYPHETAPDEVEDPDWQPTAPIQVDPAPTTGAAIRARHDAGAYDVDDEDGEAYMLALDTEGESIWIHVDVAEAIARSVSHNEIVTIPYDADPPTLAGRGATLRGLSTGHANGNDADEYWGDGWRVHLSK